MKSILSYIVLAAILSLLGAGNSLGATRTTTASGGNWNATGTWSGGVVPISTDTAVIVAGASVTVTANATVSSVTFNSANANTATLTVNSNVTLTVTAAVLLQNSATANTAALIQGPGTVTCASLTVGGTTTPTPTSSYFTATVTSTISSLNISGNLAVVALYNSVQSAANAGTFALGSGLVAVNGSVAFTTVPLFGPILTLATGSQNGTLNLSGSTPFTFTGGGSSTFNPSGTNATVIYSGAAQTVNAATYQDLTTFVGYQNLTLAGSGTKTTTGVLVNGVLSMQGTATASVSQTNGANATLEYNGSAAQTTGPELTATVPNLRINNANGVTLSSNSTIGGTLTLTNGLLTTGAKQITISTNASISGGSTNRYVNGNLQKTFSPGTQAFTFPIGDGSAYAPLALSSLVVTTSGSIKATTTPGNHPQIATSGIDATRNVNRYWTLTQSGGTFGTFGATFNYPATDVDPNTTPAQFLVQQYNAGAWLAATGSGIASTNAASITGQSGFGDFAIGNAALWANGTWRYRLPIAINHTNVAGNLTNFPVLINLTNSALQQFAKTNGYDLLFTAGDGTTKLAHEIERYTSTNGALVAWVNVPLLSSTVDTTLYLYYGNAAATNQQNAPAVWNPNYVGVWHLNQTPTGSAGDITDSTSGTNSGTSQTIAAGAQVAGKIGGSLTLDGASDYISTAASFTNPLTLTLQAWVKTTSTTGTKVIGFESSQTGTAAGSYDRHIYVGTDGKARFGTYDANLSICNTVTSSNAVNDGQWHFLVGCRDNAASNVCLYVDGVLQSTTNSYAGQSYTGWYRIGSYKLGGGWPVSANGYFNGSVDEVRIAHTVRNAAWVNTEFNNQRTSTTFSSVGATQVVAAVNLSVASVNGGSSPAVGSAFNVVIQAQDDSGTPQNVVSNTAVSLSLNTGTGVLGGTLTGTIPAGTNVITISGITYTKAESGVSFALTRTSGDNLTVSNSALFTVLPGNQIITFPSPGNQTYGVGPITLGATASSGLTVSYNVVSGPANVAGNVLTLTGAGSVTLQASQPGDSNWNAAPTTNQTFSVAQKTITGSITASNKTYDATTTAAIATRTLSGVTNSDVVSLSGGTATFANKNVGNGKTVIATGLSLTGANAANYVLASTSATNTANITKATLTVGATGVNRAYDGTTNATVALSDNRLSGDVLTTGYTAASFASKTVGNGKTVNVSGITVTGTDSGNYSANTTASTTANITKTTLTVSATGVDRVYDGTTNATVTLSDNRISGDTLTTSYTAASFTSKSVGNGKTVNVSGITVTGTDSGNYNANTTASTTANITKATLTVSATGVNRVYDGTTNATVTLSDNRIAGDVLTTSYVTASFADKNVGNGKPVNVTGVSVTGTDSGNYNANTTASTTANIAKATLTVSATGVDRVYDGTTNATVTLLDNRIAGDVLTTSYTAASFTSKNVGNGKMVNVSGITVTGTDSGNYSANTTASTTANITKTTLTVSATGVDKVYDGTTNATVTLSDNRISGDTLTTSYTAASFASKNVGNGNTVSVSGIAISGTDSGNYNANTTASTTANVTKATLTVSATGVDKVYDGTTNATVTLSDNCISGDTLTTSYTAASFTSKNVGNGKPVSVSGIAISGTDSGNYTANTTASTTANITQATLTVSATGVDRVYDGTTNATVTLSDNRIAGDVLTTSYTTAGFTDKSVGNGKPVNVNGITVTGTDSGNYNANTTASTTANITQATLTVSATGVDKVYDGMTNATVTLSDNRIAGDVLTASYTAASFTSKNVGNGKPVSVSGIAISGTDSGNYNANTTASTTANITQATLTVSATGVDKVYDGTTNAAVTLSDNRIADDVLTINYVTASFADKNVGSDKPVSVTGISVTGTESSNYNANATASTTANITQASLTVSATGVDKVYDGTTNATVTLSDNRIAGDVLTINYVTASFADKNVGTDKPVSVTGVSVTGTESSNYNANATASATANITQATLTVSATGVDKVYDGMTNATVTLSDNRIAGDVLTTSYVTASFADKNVGNGKPVSVTGVLVAGTDSSNYTANATASTTANITQATLTVSATGVDKVYDGTTNATVTLSDNRIAGDVLTNSYVAASFADKNVGNGKPVSVTGVSVTGTDSGNYNANTTANTTANITAASITVSATGVDKVYDGTTNATVTLSDNRIVGDVLTNSYVAASFADKNVGNGKPVSVTGVSVTGTDAGNYNANTTASTTANITQATLTVSATGVDRVYDGTTNATVTLSDNRIVGDVLTNSYVAASFADKNVGNGKPVSVTGVSVTGTDSGNYAFNTMTDTTANITQISLTVSADDKSRAYGTTNPQLTVSYNGFVSGEGTGVLSGNPALSTTADANSPVGAYPIVVDAGTLTATNYTFSFTNGTLTITALPPVLTITFTPGTNGQPNQFTLYCAGLTPGNTCYIQASTDLTSWTQIGTQPAAQDGTLTFTDTNSIPLRFYRLSTD